MKTSQPEKMMREEAARPQGGAPEHRISDEALRLAALMLLFALMLSLCAATYAQAEEQSVMVDGVGAVQVTRISASIEAVDQANRMLTLKGPRGNVFSVHASDRVKNLARVKVGDTVAMDYYEAIAVDVKPTEAAPALSSVTVSGRPAGQGKPAGIALRKVHIVTNVLGVSTEGQTVLIRGPLGHLAEVKVKDAQMLGSLQTGGRVDITYVEGLVLAVRPGQGA